MDAREVGANQGPLGKKLFQFALIADTHINEQERKSTSTYATNALANGRARFVFESIAQMDPPPAFAVHLGDIVHPVPALPTFEAAADRFKAIAASLQCPLYLVPGNHDVGDKIVEWMPADTVTPAHIDKYRRLFGADYFAFDHGGCRFVVLNAQLINSGLTAEQEQKAWLETEAQRWAATRCFLFLHYPPYVSDAKEPGGYDNIDEPGRTWLLDLVRDRRPEGIFAGHVHNFWYDVIGGSQMYLLPATSFLRHDYSELFRAGPVQEFGRNDTGKFGYFLVDVHEGGHVAHFVRTDGATLDENESLPPPIDRVALVHTRTNFAARVGVDLRHPWAELVEIAATGGVQEFERKVARNDYPVLALWEMGVRRLRVPLQDLLDPRVRDRMELLRRIGHEFLVYSYDLPDADAQHILRQSSGLVSMVEVVLPWTRIPGAMAGLAQIRRSSGVKVVVSKLRTHEDAKFDGSRFSHFINHGFHTSETHQLKDLFEGADALSIMDGISFRVSRRDAIPETFRELARLGAAFGFRPIAHVRLASDHPGDAMDDDLSNASRVAETVLSAAVEPSVTAFIDTFMDVDRGYFPRNGFIDRRCNPRLPMRVYAHLHAALAAWSAGDFASAACLRTPSSLMLRMPDDRELALITSPTAEMHELSGALGTAAGQRAIVIDLDSGRRVPLLAGRERSGERHGVPYLIVIDGRGQTPRRAVPTAAVEL